MRFTIFVLAGLIMTGSAGAEENRVTVRGLSQRLQLTGWQASWVVQGEIVPPVHALRGGNLLAIVHISEGDSRSLVLWSKDGHELARSPFDIAGEVKAGQVFGNRLVVASASEIAEIDTTTLHKGRARSFVVQTTKTTLFRPSPTGLWVVGDKAVSYFDLDGRQPAEKARPLVAIDKPRCPDSWAEAKQPCSAGLQLGQTEAVVSEAGDLLLTEVFKEIYPYEDAPGLFDEVLPSTATVLDTKGATVAQRPLSWMKTKWEWLWSKGRSPQDPTGLPRWGGLVRTRYETDWNSLGLPVGARGGDLLFLRGQVLVRVDRQLGTLWKKTLGDVAPPVTSPPWASHILLHNSVCYHFASISDRGSDRQAQTINIADLAMELWKNDYKRPRFAIGQSSEGDWLLIAY
jgi:hypothetical protein